MFIEITEGKKECGTYSFDVMTTTYDSSAVFAYSLSLVTLPAARLKASGGFDVCHSRDFRSEPLMNNNVVGVAFIYFASTSRFVVRRENR